MPRCSGSRFPFGGLTAEQLEALGRVVRDYVPLGKGHITTRENIQLHFIPLENTPEVMRVIGEAGLSTREACGNTVRNVTSCPMAGVCQGEIFDVTPYVGAFARYFLRHPFTQTLPRKFKVAFSGCPTDCAITGIHDLGFLAQTRSENGQQSRGFRIVTGGGLSILPRVAYTLYDFVPISDYLKVSEAGDPHLPPLGRAPKEQDEGPDQVPHRPHRNRRLPGNDRRGTAATLDPGAHRPGALSLSGGRVRQRPRRPPPISNSPTGTTGPFTTGGTPTSYPKGRRAITPSS